MHNFYRHQSIHFIESGCQLSITYQLVTDNEINSLAELGFTHVGDNGGLEETIN